ncbi:BTB/POZ domain-containing protein, partial [Striga asiatica]
CEKTSKTSLANRLSISSKLDQLARNQTGRNSGSDRLIFAEGTTVIWCELRVAASGGLCDGGGGDESIPSSATVTFSVIVAAAIHREFEAIRHIKRRNRRLVVAGERPSRFLKFDSDCVINIWPSGLGGGEWSKSGVLRFARWQTCAEAWRRPRQPIGRTRWSAASGGSAADGQSFGLCQVASRRRPLFACGRSRYSDGLREAEICIPVLVDPLVNGSLKDCGLQEAGNGFGSCSSCAVFWLQLKYLLHFFQFRVFEKTLFQRILCMDPLVNGSLKDCGLQEVGIRVRVLQLMLRTTLVVLKLLSLALHDHLMEPSHNHESMTPGTIGNRSTSDLVVRIRTHEGRDEWVYCHSHVLTKSSSYFADRLSDKWPTCQILDSRTCVEVHCTETDFDHHITLLRLLHRDPPSPTVADICNAKNALGMLRAAVGLGSPQVVSACAEYLEAVPWNESEEEEILRVVPGLGLGLAESGLILARLKPVGPKAAVGVFMSALRLATSPLSGPARGDARAAAQEQIEYMLTDDDDDPPLLTVDHEIRAEARRCVGGLLARFAGLMKSEPELLDGYLADLSWASQIVAKLGICEDFVRAWVEMSGDFVKVAGPARGVKVLEVTNRVMETISCGGVVLRAARRAHVVRTWVPFARDVKLSVDCASVACVDDDDDDDEVMKADGELWRSLESGFVSIISTLPSESQSEILTEWLGNKNVGYPDLTEAFEVWCYRSKVAKRRLGLVDEGNQCNNNTNNV